MANPDPYSRSYHRFADEYPDIYQDDAAYALWSRLRDEADKSWPSSAALPHGTRKAPLRKLMEARQTMPDGSLLDAPLVTLKGMRYRVRGMDKQRSERQDKARAAAEEKWKREQARRDALAEREHSGSSALAMHIPRRDETSIDETRRDEPRNLRARLDPNREGLPHLTADAQEAIEAVAQRPITTASDKVLTHLDELVERHGCDLVAQTMGAVQNGGSKTWPQLVYGTRNRLDPLDDRPNPKAEALAQEAADNERRRRQEAKVMEEPWRQEFRKTLEARDAGT